jgi:hypothetical protein
MIEVVILADPTKLCEKSMRPTKKRHNAISITTGRSSMISLAPHRDRAMHRGLRVHALNIGDPAVPEM